jgi:hypothetical protein
MENLTQSKIIENYKVGDVCAFLEAEEDSPRVFTTHKVDMDFGVVYYYKLNGVEETIGISNIRKLKI